MKTSHESSIRLGDIAHARSGDKGDRANVGVVANDRARFAFLQEYLTAEAVADYFRAMGIGPVVRYELPNLLAFNFVIESALGGGASRSLRFDTQGKALGAAIMELRLEAEPPLAREES